MSRRLRMCMANGDGESTRPSYGRSKLTLISKEKQISSVVFAKIIRPLILMLEQNPPEKMFEMYRKRFCREAFALKSQLWPINFGKHRPIFASSSRSTGISQFQAGITRSKRACSHLQKKSWACCELTFDATNLPKPSLNHSTPKFAGIPQKLT